MEYAAVAIGDLLPHGREMTLIDRLVEYTPQRSVVALTIGKNSKFSLPTGVPAWVGIEYMAQAIAAHAGYEARLRGVLPAIGFLLGTRDYRCEASGFPLGATLTITVEPLVVDQRLGAFRCAIAAATVLATAVVNVYVPTPDELPAARRAAGAG
jgi:predicted hotdog family 3-hydroxylacyl-ACP dehydratase